MLKIEVSTRVATVSGPPCEVMLFYCFWQTKLWPDWMQYIRGRKPNDEAIRQHKFVVKAINACSLAGATIDLNDWGSNYVEARLFAVESCLALAIDVDRPEI